MNTKGILKSNPNKTLPVKENHWQQIKVECLSNDNPFNKWFCLPEMKYWLWKMYFPIKVLDLMLNKNK